MKRQRRTNRRSADRREARVREAEKAIRWTLNFCRVGMDSRALRNAAEALVDGRLPQRRL